MNRESGCGGGVALFVDKGIIYKAVDNMSVFIDDKMECITIELCLEKTKNVLVSCVYRKPGSNIKIFIEKMEKMFNKVKHKISYICGDFNIDLLNPNNHKLTEEFIETLYSFPTITKPTRITGNGATLIDNIFTNNVESNSLSGILINDISDHLPIFVTYDCN